MSAPGMLTPLRSETFENLQLNAGVFLKNFEFNSYTSASALKAAIVSLVSAGTNLLGATRGGGSFTVTREMRTPDADGKRYRFKGDTFVDSVDAQISTTMIEITPQNIKDAFGSATINTSGKVTTITVQTAIGSSDYLTNLCWVGDLADGRFVLICLDNALNTADFSLTFTDKGEGTVPVEFHAFQSNVEDYDNAPFKIVYFDTDGDMSSMTVTSAAGTNVGDTDIEVNHTKTAGQHFVYKIGTTTTAPSIGYHEQADYTWTEWNGSSEIAVGASANGKKITIAVVDSSNRAELSGSATLVVKTA